MELVVKSGFTLMEICVSLAVLSAGVIVFGHFLDGFNHLRSLEREKARAVVNVADAGCRDDSFVLNGVNVSLVAVPGAKPLAWAYAFSDKFKEVGLRRLVRCKKIR